MNFIFSQAKYPLAALHNSNIAITFTSTKNNNMKKNLLSALTICFFLFACNSDAPKTETATTATTASSFNLDAAKADIAASSETFGSAFANGDSVNFASHYTSDACINPSNMPKMCGTAAITAFFNGGYKMGIRGIKITTAEVMGGIDAVVETGTYEMFADKNVSIDKGKFIAVWKQENGKWKMYRDIWNTDMPAAAPAK